jgi:cell division protein FtsI/penicillin-binding protein 2
LGVIVSVALLLSIKLYTVQIVHGEEFSNRADRQYLRPNAKLFDRGTISFQTKDGEIIDAGTLQMGYTLAINPSMIPEPADVYNNLSFVLKDIDEDTFFARVSKSDDPYEELVKRLPKSDADKIEALELPGVSLFKDRWRFYPGKSLAAHSIGFLSWKDDEHLGRYGLERQYENILNRNSGDVFANFFVEIFSGLSETLKGGEQEGSIVTTIEPTVQTFVEKELELVHEDWRSDTIGAIVMNPQTGAIYAMGLYPTFDLNAFNEVESVSVFNNQLVEGVYEMGSIVKPLTVAIGLDTGAITADTTYEDKGQLTADGYTIYNYDKKARGVVDMQEVLNKSLNTGVSFIVRKVGNEQFAAYLKRLIGEPTGIDLPNEGTPLLSNLENNRDIEYMTASYGQGVAMTPIAMTRALAALGNGGYMVQPHIVSKIEYASGISKIIDPEKGAQIFSQKTSEEISRMLTTVVDEALAGGEVALPHYSVAAKTGTAQIAKAGGGYYDDQYLHSFFGYFPAFDPEFIIFLYHVNPKGAEYASQTLTEPFMNITKFLINYYEIPPDR